MSPTIAVCQMRIDDLDVETNHDRIRERLDDLGDDVDLAVFPEQTLTGFVPDERIEAAALARDSAPIDDLRSIADERGVAIVVGFVEAADTGFYNATAYIGPSGDLTVYRKRHLWAGERRVLAPGTELVTVATPLGEAGVLTCYDLNFVDDSAALVREDVTALLVVGAWPGAYSENWRLLLRARALDGVRWAIGAGRTGRREIADAPPVTYAGRSLIARPDGGIHQALDRQERTLLAELDPEVLATQRDLIGVFED